MVLRLLVCIGVLIRFLSALLGAIWFRKNIACGVFRGVGRGRTIYVTGVSSEVGVLHASTNLARRRFNGVFNVMGSAISLCRDKGDYPGSRVGLGVYGCFGIPLSFLVNVSGITRCRSRSFGGTVLDSKDYRSTLLSLVRVHRVAVSSVIVTAKLRGRILRC